MNGIKIFAVMVIYNKCLKDSVTYQCLKGRNIKLIVCDNSTTFCQNEQIAGEDFTEYLSMGGNKGLSFAYNRALDYIFSELEPEPEDYVCFFDDDTKVPDEYFEKLLHSDARILLPIVNDTLGIMSPVFMPGGIAKRFSSKEKVLEADSRHISGINSAMAVKVEVYKDYRYNEEMFLDYIDHKFIMDMRERRIYPSILDIDIEQNFSAVQDSKEAQIKRFCMQKRDLRIFYEGRPLLYYFVVIKKHFKLAIKYSDIKLLFC